MAIEDFPKEYQRLIKQVRKIDEKAAEYLENEAPKRDLHRHNYDLSACFNFVCTRQGPHYWRGIFDKLEQKRAEYDDLVCRIASLGVEQSVIDYLRGEAMDVWDFELSNDLTQVFSWRDTPHGYHFWQGLNKALVDAAEMTDFRIFDEGIEPKPQEVFCPDLMDVQKRFSKLLEFKRKHCPGVVFDPFQDNYTVAYMHEEERWTPVFAHVVENPTAVFLSEEAAYLLAEQLNSGEFEL